MNKNNKKIISAGHICLDITPVFPDGRDYDDISSIFVPGKTINVDAADVHTGGSVANTGLALKKLGMDVMLLAKVGDDSFGDMIKNIVSSYGAGGLITDKDCNTSYSVVLAVPGIDRVFLHSSGANNTFKPEDVSDDVLSEAALFHFGYPTLMRHMYENDGDALCMLFKRVKSFDVATSLDLSTVQPDSDAGHADWKKILEKTLPYVDFFVPSFEELCFMLDREKYDRLVKTGKDIDGIIDMQEDVLPLAKRSLELGCGVVMIKCGTAGILYLSAESDRIAGIGSRLEIDVSKWCNVSGTRSCYDAGRVLSATGAGDTCIAAFLAGVIKGFKPEKCVKLASAQGACCVTCYDALSGLKTLEELEKMTDS